MQKKKSGKLRIANAKFLVFLQIYDGYDENSPELFFGCDRSSPEPLVSTGNVVYVSMVKNYARTAALFQLQWAEVPLGQGLNATVRASNITGMVRSLEISFLSL